MEDIMRHFTRSIALLAIGTATIAGYQIVYAGEIEAPIEDRQVIGVVLEPSPVFEHIDDIGLLRSFHETEVYETVTKSTVLVDEPQVTVQSVPVKENRCPEWEPVAMAAGWEPEHWDRFSYIIYRESRCLPDAFNGSDPNSGSRGLSQINGFWCRPSKYYPDGWLQDQGVLSHCDDLYDPMVNLTAAKAIFDYGVDRGNCPWGPWTTRNTRWC
jgi:hypothetical protein